VSPDCHANCTSLGANPSGAVSPSTVNARGAGELDPFVLELLEHAVSMPAINTAATVPATARSPRRVTPRDRNASSRPALAAEWQEKER
jgi:hypothetical protein